MSVGNKTLMHRWFEEVWNKKNPNAVDELLAPGALLYGLGDSPMQPVKGPEEFKVFWKRFVEAFPDIQVAVESTISEGDKVAARCSVRGTHSGNGLGVPPTGKRINITGVAIAGFKDGQVVEGWNNFDFFALYQQLDLLSMKGSGAA